MNLAWRATVSAERRQTGRDTDWCKSTLEVTMAVVFPLFVLIENQIYAIVW